MTLKKMQMVMGMNGVIQSTAIVDNSSVQGIFSFGGFAFPILGVCSDPDLTIQVRDAAGDRETYRLVTPFDSPNNFLSVWRISGTNFDQGGAGYDTDGVETQNGSFCSHGRWITNAGVGRTVQRTTGIHIRSNINPYPILFSYVYDLTATFTG